MQSYKSPPLLLSSSSSTNDLSSSSSYASCTAGTSSSSWIAIDRQSAPSTIVSSLPLQQPSILPHPVFSSSHSHYNNNNNTDEFIYHQVPTIPSPCLSDGEFPASDDSEGEEGSGSGGEGRLINHHNHTNTPPSPISPSITAGTLFDNNSSLLWSLFSSPSSFFQGNHAIPPPPVTLPQWTLPSPIYSPPSTMNSWSMMHHSDGVDHSIGNDHQKQLSSIIDDAINDLHRDDSSMIEKEKNQEKKFNTSMNESKTKILELLGGRTILQLFNDLPSYTHSLYHHSKHALPYLPYIITFLAGFALAKLRMNNNNNNPSTNTNNTSSVPSIPSPPIDGGSTIAVNVSESSSTTSTSSTAVLHCSKCDDYSQQLYNKDSEIEFWKNIAHMLQTATFHASIPTSPINMLLRLQAVLI